MKKTFLIIFIILFLCVPFLQAQEQTVSLKVSVTNPSFEEAQEINVDLDLPAELRLDDIISSDGLRIDINAETGTLYVNERATLQAGETTFYEIVVKDLWLIPEAELKNLRDEISSFRLKTDEYYILEKLDVALEGLGDVLSKQRDAQEDIIHHILTYREIKPQYEKIKSNFIAIRDVKKSRADKSRDEDNQNITLKNSDVFNLFLLCLFGLSLYAAYQNRKKIMKFLAAFGIEQHLQFAKIFETTEMTYKLLIHQDSSPMAETENCFSLKGDLSDGHMCLFIQESYRAQTVLEIKIKFKDTDSIVMFRGPVIWQKKMSIEAGQETYLTGIKINEIVRDDLERLKIYIHEHTQEVIE